MPTPHRRGFTIAEALVATALVAVSAALFVQATIVTTAARRRTGRLRAAAAAVRERAAFAADARCRGADSSGTALAGTVTEHWRVAADADGVDWRDSVVLDGAPPIVAAGRIPCSG